MRPLLALSLLAIGCGHETPESRFQDMTFVPEPEGTRAAYGLVWNEVYGMDVAAPRSYWVLPNCPNGSAGTFSNIGSPYKCLGGVTINDGFNGILEVYVVKVDTIARSGLAHELWHAAMWMRDGTTDPGHKSAGFQPGGEVDMAQALLKEYGL